MHDKYITFENGILEIEKGTTYAVPSKSDQGTYRTVKVSVKQDGELILSCDCERGYWQPTKKCWHVKEITTLLKYLITQKGLNIPHEETESLLPL